MIGKNRLMKKRRTKAAAAVSSELYEEFLGRRSDRHLRRKTHFHFANMRFVGRIRET